MEDKIIVDTDVLINHFNNRSSLLSQFALLDKPKKPNIIVSVVTIYEFYSGQSLKKHNIFTQTEELFQLFTVQNITPEIAKMAAEINRKEKLYGKIGLGDLLIGSTALYLDARLFTLNKRHFRCIPELKFT